MEKSALVSGDKKFRNLNKYSKKFIEECNIPQCCHKMFTLPGDESYFTFIDANMLKFDWNDNSWCNIPHDKQKDVNSRIAKMREHFNHHEKDGCENYTFTKRRNALSAVKSEKPSKTDGSDSDTESADSEHSDDEE